MGEVTATKDLRPAKAHRSTPGNSERKARKMLSRACSGHKRLSNVMPGAAYARDYGADSTVNGPWSLGLTPGLRSPSRVAR